MDEKLVDGRKGENRSATETRERRLADGADGRGQSAATGTSGDWLVDGCGQEQPDSI